MMITRAIMNESKGRILKRRSKRDLSRIRTYVIRKATMLKDLVTVRLSMIRTRAINVRRSIFLAFISGSTSALNTN